MKKTIINTPKAPAAIGTYSQAVQAGNLLFVSGQIPLDPETMLIIEGGARAQLQQIFQNLKAVLEAADYVLSDCVKLTVYLTDLKNFPLVNEVMETFFDAPYPARAAVGVSELPKGVAVEVDAIAIKCD